MAYVDLNPVRAQMAKTPESSEYTSIQERITPKFDLGDAVICQSRSGDLLYFQTSLKPLLHFGRNQANHRESGIPYAYHDYLALVDWTGRILRKDKRGVIDTEQPPILERLGISLEQWAINTTQFEEIHDRRFNRIAAVFDTG
jgi:hypothetical protein